ncbi:MAG: ComF family protein, partial [Candidatus Kerfeldbacteria bacterium]|nr:ComF family protein [Candidatus Kerfeldbacteria bacterium]
ICLGSYEVPILAQAVQRLKYHGGQTLATPLGRALSDHLLPGFRPATIVPVPLHRSRQRERGFNQSQLLAESLSVSSGLECRAIVRRNRRTLSQVTLDEADRQLNVRDAFTLVPGVEIIPKHAIIVDDVFTTGATISAVARVLRTAGTTDITAVTVAKG